MYDSAVNTTTCLGARCVSMTLRGSKDKKGTSDTDGGAGSSSTAAGNGGGIRPGGERHGSTESSGADSYRSTDTIKGPFANMRGTPMKVNTATKKLGYVCLFRRCCWGGRHGLD